MSETRQPANTATFKEIVINSGSAVEKVKAAGLSYAFVKDPDGKQIEFVLKQ